MPVTRRYIYIDLAVVVVVRMKLVLGSYVHQIEDAGNQKYNQGYK